MFVVKRRTPLKRDAPQCCWPETLIVGMKMFFTGNAQFTHFSSRPNLFFLYKRSLIPHNKDIPRSPQEQTENTKQCWYSRIQENNSGAAKLCLVRKKKVVRRSSQVSSYSLVEELEDQPLSHETPIINLGIQSFSLW